MSPRLIWRLWAAGLVALLAVGYLAEPGWWLPPPAPRLVQARQPFSLPAAPNRDDPQLAHAILAQAPLWGPLAPSGAAQPAAELDPWQLSGTYRRDDQWFAVVTWKSGQQQAKHLKVGQETPGGHRILEIAEDRVQVLLETRRNKPVTLWLPLHQTAPPTY